MLDSMKLLQSEIWASPLVMLLFIVSVIYLIYRERQKEEQHIRFMLIYTAFVVVLYLMNPVVSFVLVKATRDPYAFIRLAWMVPAFPLMAYAAKEALMQLGGKKRLVAVLVLMAVIISSGSYLTAVNIRATNAYKIPDEVQRVCDIILDREGITDPVHEGGYITVDVQLHDTNILEDGSESNVFYYGIRQYAKSFVLNRTTLTPSEYEREDFSYSGYFSNHCRYYICDKSDAITRELGEIGYELLGETESHAVYENTYSYNLFVVRHGQTEANVANRLVGHTESPMTEEGQRTTKELGKALTGVTFAKSYTSPLERTTQTAQNVLTESGNVNVEIIANSWLYDLNFGEAEGMTWDEIRATYGADFDFNRLFGAAEDADLTPQIFGAATLNMYLQTVGAGINLINTDGATNHLQDANILLANHSGLRYWMEQQMPGTEIPAGLENAGLTILRYNRGIWEVEVMNETDYDAIAEMVSDLR